MEHSTEQADKKSYYAVIPAAVRYDSELSSGEKLLYGEITALCNEKGYCWASNKYFAKLYGKHVDTITRWLKNLVELEYIRSIIDRDAGNSRRLYLSAKVQIATCKNAGSLPAPMRVAASKNAVQNNKDNNKLKNKDNNSKDFSPGKLSKTNAESRGYSLLIQVGVAAKVAKAIVFEQQTPLESIEEAIKNGLAKGKYQTGFVLEPGYIVAALNGARKEGKVVGPTKKSNKLKNQIEQKKKLANRQPMNETEFADRKNRFLKSLRR